MMKVILKTLNYEYDITEYVDRPIAQNKAVGDVFDSATVIIPFIQENAFTGIDLSRRIPRLSVVEVTDIEETRQYYVVKAEVDKNKDGEYRHTLELKSPEILLQLRPISDYAITQPIDSAYVFINEISTSKTQVNYYDITEISHQVMLNVEGITVDDEYIDDRVLKKVGKYKVNFSTTFNYADIGGWFKGLSIVFELDGIEVYTREINDIKYFELPVKVNVTQEIENTTTSELKVFIRGYSDNEGASLGISNTTLEIIYNESVISTPIYMDEVVDKLLRLTSVNVKEFDLDENTRSRLALVKAYDIMETDVTLYDALNKIANYVKAKVRLKLENGKKIIWFEYYDDLAKAEYVNVDNDQVNILSELNEYTSALELRNNNIIKETIISETHTLRTVGTSQITTDNIMGVLEHPIDRVVRVQIAGKEFKDTSNNVVNPATAVNITERVVLKDYYNTLNDLESYDDRLEDTKNNHLWYERGSNIIGGMEYCGIQFEKFTLEQTNRALYETMATQLERDLGVSIKKFNDNGLDDDENIAIRVDYIPLSESNAVIHKDNQLGFEDKIIRKINASDRVNNADMLGSYVRQKVNAVGGTQVAISGYADSVENIPKLASKNDDYRVVSVSKYSYDDDVTFIATLVKDYIYESEYVGIDSDRRLYRIPKDEYVDRVDKALNIMYFSKERIDGNDTAFNLEGLVSILTTSAGSFVPPKLAYLSYDDKEVSSYLDINAIGNTVEFRTSMVDNYSAGNRKLKTTLSEGVFTYQRGVPYVDLFGNADNLLVEYYAYLDNLLISNLNSYPEGHLIGSGLLGSFSYPIKKDARERSILSTQISFLTNDDDIIIYDGIAKYNRQVINELKDVRMAKLNYEPNRYDKFIEVGLADILSNETELKSGYIEFYADSVGDYAWFDNESKELLFVVKNANIGSNKVYYYGRNYEIGESMYMPVKVGRLDSFIETNDNVVDNYIIADIVNEKPSVDLEFLRIPAELKEVEAEPLIIVSKDDSYIYADTVNNEVAVALSLGVMDIENKQIEETIETVIDLVDFYLESETINETHEIYAVAGRKRIELLAFDKAISVIDTTSNSYITIDDIKSVSVLSSDLGTIDVFRATVNNDVVTVEVVSDDYIMIDSQAGVVVLDSETTHYEYPSQTLSANINAQEITDDFYISNDNITVDKTVSSDLGTYAIIGKTLSSNVVGVANKTDSYLTDDIQGNVIRFNVETTKHLTHIKGTITGNFNAVETITSNYIISENKKETIKPPTTITRTAIATPQFASPIVTLKTSQWCGEITLTVENDNNFSVVVYGDNVNLGTLNANSTKDYTFGHSLNGGFGAMGGDFYKTISFGYQGQSVETNYSVYVSPLCQIK